SYSESQQYDKALHFLDRLDAQSNNTFNQESAWHRSLLLLQKGEMDKAKELLQKIISAKGFYATAAQQKLSEIK
ncbi:MAG TPA: tetratricopeptide repeat protein, partial [Bacteroidia bacterium]|nr:tetratricopeptide repeat protein [Bacteroidia bacterium]